MSDSTLVNPLSIMLVEGAIFECLKNAGSTGLDNRWFRWPDELDLSVVAGMLDDGIQIRICISRD